VSSSLFLCSKLEGRSANERSRRATKSRQRNSNHTSHREPPADRVSLQPRAHAPADRPDRTLAGWFKNFASPLGRLAYNGGVLRGRTALLLEGIQVRWTEVVGGLKTSSSRSVLQSTAMGPNRVVSRCSGRSCLPRTVRANLRPRSLVFDRQKSFTAVFEGVYNNPAVPGGRRFGGLLEYGLV
jgi:hypothetical protein